MSKHGFGVLQRVVESTGASLLSKIYTNLRYQKYLLEHFVKKKIKKSEYNTLPPLYDLTPNAVQTLGAVRKSTLNFLQEFAW